MSEKYLLNADDVAMRLEVSKAKAYKVIKELNEELKKMGFIIISGRLPRTYFEKKFFGYNTDTELVTSQEGGEYAGV